MSPEVVGEEYVRLALAIDEHSPGYIEAYFGPAAWQEQAQTEGPRALPELAQQAALLADTIATADGLDEQRREFLTRQVKAMQTSLRLLLGESMALADEVESLYDVRPSWVEESLFAETYRLLDELLLPGDSLRERVAQRKQGLELSAAQLSQLIPSIHRQLRQLSRDRFPLPEEESVEFAFVQDQPWMAYNWYQGRGRSQIEINTDSKLYITDLVNLVAHEAYPGHHTEFSIKDFQLGQQAGRVEHCLALVNAPSCVVSEGIATCALASVLSDEEWVAWHAAEIFPMAGLAHLDAQRERMIELALERLNGVYGNAAFLLHEQGAGEARVRAYLQQYGLLTEQEADHMIGFMSAPLDRAYIFTYYWGQKLVEELFAVKGERPYWYARLLTEAVTPTLIRQWTQA